MYIIIYYLIATCRWTYIEQTNHRQMVSTGGFQVSWSKDTDLNIDSSDAPNGLLPLVTKSAGPLWKTCSQLWFYDHLWQRLAKHLWAVVQIDIRWLAVQKVANCHGPDGSLFFIACIEQNDNELLALETAWGSQSCVLPRSERIMRSHQFRGTPQTNLIKGESSSKYSCPGNKLFCI